jgi:hypothetical protein
MYKKFFVAALTLLALVSFNAHRANAQSCPNRETYGVRPNYSVDKTLQSQIEVTYFTTDDPNAFISEKAGIRRSASYTNMNSNQFVAKVASLEKDGLASIRKQQSAVAFLGEMAELNLERNAVNSKAGMVNAGLVKTNSLAGLDRKTEISVLKGASNDGDYYRLSVLSWYVENGQKIVDYDAIVLVKPGQTAVFKLMSDYEVKRGGAARSYVAVTMRGVNNTSLASLRRSR